MGVWFITEGRHSVSWDFSTFWWVQLWRACFDCDLEAVRYVEYISESFVIKLWVKSSSWTGPAPPFLLAVL